MREWYKVLGVAEDAPEEVIRAAYKALARKYHPDNNQIFDLNPDDMVEINVAYEEAIKAINNREKDDFTKTDYRDRNDYEAKEVSNHNQTFSGENPTNKGIGCGCLTIIMVAIAIVIFFNRTYIMRCFSESFNNSVEQTASVDNYSKEDCEYPVSVLMDGMRDSSEAENNVYGNIFTKEFVQWVAEKYNTYDIKQRDEVLDADEYYTEVKGEYTYSVSSTIKGDTATVEITINYTDYPKVIRETMKELKAKYKRASDLGAKMYFSEVSQKVKKEKYQNLKNKQSKTFRFTVIKNNGDWKISKCDDFFNLIVCTCADAVRIQKKENYDDLNDYYENEEDYTEDEK